MAYKPKLPTKVDPATVARMRKALQKEAEILARGRMGAAAAACNDAASMWPDETCQRLADYLKES